MATLEQAMVVPVGTYKQFGETGPVYEVVSAASPEDGRSMAHIVIVQTGEELDYPLELILGDQEAI